MNFNILALLLLKTLTYLTCVVGNGTTVPNGFEDQTSRTTRTTSSDILDSSPNDKQITLESETTNWFSDGQRLVTDRPSTLYVTERKTITSESMPTLKYTETERITNEKITQTHETNSYGKDVTLTSPSIAAVYEEESGRSDGMDEHESVTSKSLLTKYTDKSIMSISESREHSQICDFCLYEGQGNFTSYGYPMHYRNNLNCTYRILRIDDSDVCEVELFFHDFDIPISSLPSTAFQSSRNNLRENDCHEDYLEVNGRKYCGSGWRDHSEMISFPSNQRELVFRFVSNEKTSGKGFWAEVRRRVGTCYGTRLKPQAAQVCEERFSEIEFEMKSPQFPQNYPLNADCAYYIRKANEDVCGLELTFFKFDVEMVEGCAYDYLEIDGQKYCGSLPDNAQNIFKFESDQKLISFQSDAQMAKSGFHIHAKQITDCRPPSLPAPPSCNVCTSEGFGTLVSYGYPDHYRNNLLCTYTIDRRNADYCYVEFQFEDFELQDSDHCEADYLQMEGQRYCSDTLKLTKRTIAFDGNDKGIVLVFKTDLSKTKRGFLIQYKQLECTNDLALEKASPVSAVVPASQRQCDYVYTEKEFIIRSENFSKSYANNLDCSYYVKQNTSQVCYLELTFIKFDVEASPECQYDYLEVGNTVRLCGTLQTETVRTYIFDEHEKLIKFHSDASTNRNGYLIKAQQLECKGDKIIREPSLTTPTSLIPSSTRHSVEESTYCSQVFEHQELTIISPNYPNPYAPNMDCLYMIKKISSNICKLDISFDDFEIQPSDPNSYCKYDFVDFNGIRVCGDVVKGDLRSYYFQTDTFPIHFHSDNSVTSSDRGFRVFVRQSECETNQIIPVEKGINEQDFHIQEPPLRPQEPPPRPQLCNKMYTETVFELKSPNYPDSYPNNLNCRYTVIKRNDIKICQLEVNFIDMNLEKTDDCQRDYLNFNGQLMCGSLPGETTRYYLFEGNEFTITFASDSYQNDRGFFLRIRQKECPPDNQNQIIRQPFGNGLAQCGAVYRETSFELKSPQYPEYYENNLDCVYTIKRKNENICRIELRFIDFDVEPSPGCSYDYLMIDGKKLCGDMKTNQMKTIQFYEPEKVLMFRSGSSSNRRGFLIKGQQKECEAYTPITQSTSLSQIPSICELCFTEVMGTIQSYDYPNNYPPNLNCKYKITPLPGNCMVQINFEEFSLENSYSENCDTDYLEINSVKYCGKQLEGATRVLTFNKHPNEVAIRFITNSQNSGRGFRASYTQLPCIGGVPTGHQQFTPHQRTPPFISPSGVSHHGSQPITIIDKPKAGSDPALTRIPCDLVIYDTMFEIKSQNYPKHYPQNSDCLFSIKRVNSNICKLKLRFVFFDVKGNDKDCSGDSLEILGNKICGRLPNNTIKEFSFNSYKTSLRFRSDSYLSSNGFKIRGEQVDCSAESRVPISQPSSDQTRQYSSPIPSQYGSYNTQPSVQPQYPPQSSGKYSPTHSQAHHSVPPSFADSSPQQTNYYYNPNAPYNPPEPLPQPSPPLSMPSPQQPDYHYRSTPSPPHSPPKSFPPSESPSSQVFSHSNSNYDPYPERRIPPSMPINRIKTSTSSQQMPNYNSKSNYQQNYNQFHSNRDSMHSQPHRSQPPYQLDPPQTGPKHQISMNYESHKQYNRCDEMIQSMYFEIKSPNESNSQCMYTIQKASDNICQLDMMFTSFEMGDPTCHQEYLAVGGERLCGKIPKNTIRTYKFNGPDMFIYMKAETMGHGKGFDIKGRQVECNAFQMNPDSQRSHSQPHVIGASFSSYRNKPQQQQSGGSDDARIRGRPYNNQQIGQTIPKNQGFSSNYDGFDTRRPYGPKTSGAPYSQEVREANVRCDLIFSELDFTITSPNHPNSYPTNIYCRYTIRQANPNVCAIDMKFDSFEIEDDPKCAKDYLEVDAGRICGVLPPSHERRYYFLPEEYEKVLTFKSDSFGSKRGFSLHVRQITDCNKPWKPMSITSPTVCDVCNHNLRGQITSSNYPNQYSDYTRCSYRIQAMGPQYCQVRLYLRDIDIESSPSGDCDKDALVIDSERLCGRDTNTRDMTLTFPSSEPREVQINFQSDASGSGRGFHIEYVQESCPPTRSPSVAQPIIPIDANLNRFPSDSVQPKGLKPENRIGTLIPPIYPPNYVSRAHIEEIVQTQVQVLEKKDNDTNRQNNEHSIVK